MSRGETDTAVVLVSRHLDNAARLVRPCPDGGNVGMKLNLRALAVLAAAGLALTACGSSDSSSTAGGSGSCGHYNLAFLGATTGPAGALGQNMVGGIKLALSEYNKDHADCKDELKVFDSQGDPTKATPLATKIVQD